ncbi:MAG: hypothetical protein P8Z35_24485 [Ignavibacteriaceae bacterium]|jgi:hypothetical protein
MKLLVKFISYICLGLTLIPSFLVFTGNISLDFNKTLMFIGTIIWFVSAPSWMNKTEE